MLEQKVKGGNPTACVVYSYLYGLFDEDDKSIAETYRACRTGERMCGDCKNRLAERVAKFLEEHQRRREEAKSKVDDFLLKEQ